MAITYRNFDYYNEDICRLFDLIRKVYGPSNEFEKRWNWEYFENPKSKKIKILIAEDDQKIIGCTTRMPVTILLKGYEMDGFFSINTMSDPSYRRRGIVKNLYKMASETMPLQLSKGSALNMYKLLLKIGYRPIAPNTFMVAVLSPFRWLLWRARLSSPKINFDPHHYNLPDSFVSISNFDHEFDEFWNRVSVHYEGIVAKDSAYMNWRYVSIPHLSYKKFYRKKDARIVAMVVLRSKGSSGLIVDIIWDQDIKDEPACTIDFAKDYFKKRGVIKLFCWGTLSKLRKSLKRSHFFDRGEMTNFSVYATPEKMSCFSYGDKFHFVHGDSDSDYS
jgi:hypothetical protein